MCRVRNILFPRLCPLCRKGEIASRGCACDACDGSLQRITAPKCNACGGNIDGVLDVCSECLQGPRSWNTAISVFCFTGSVRSLLHRFKYQGDIALTPYFAGEALAAWRASMVSTPDLVVPVPMHWFKELRRGYNQSQLLADELSTLGGMTVGYVLRRIRATKSQAALDRRRRRRNLRGAFYVPNEDRVQQKRILLIDDVLTTGATLDTCTRALLKAGARSVDVLTVARG